MQKYDNVTLLNNTNFTLITNVSGKNEDNGSQESATIHPDMAVTEAFRLFFTVALSSIALIGFLGNLFVLISFAVIPKLKTPVNLFLVSLSLAEFIICIGVLPLELEWHLRRTFIHTVFVCEFVYTLHFALLSCSAINLMAVSAFRFYTIAYPFPAKAIKRRHILIVIMPIWIYSAISGLLPVLGWRPVETAVENGSCYFQAEPAYLLFIVVANYILPAILIIFFYGKIFFISHRHAIKIAKNHICSDEERRKRKKRVVLFKGAITLAKIVGTFMLCWAPYIVDLILFFSKLQPPRMMHLTFYVLAYSNIAVNPFLYAGFCEDFRSVFCKCLRTFGHLVTNQRDFTTTTRRASSSIFQSYKINSPSPWEKESSALFLHKETAVTAI